MIGWYIWRGRKSTSSMTLSGFENLDERVGTSRIWLRHLLFVFRLVVITLIIIVLARPQSSNQWEKVTTEGIDIVMCMDVSGSMRAMDFKPNRLEASKSVGIEFVNARQDDRFGLAVFAGTPVVIILLFSLAVGALLALLLLATYLMMLLLGYFTGALFIGEAGLRLIGTEFQHRIDRRNGTDA